MKNYISASNPEAAIERAAYVGQPAHMRKYRPGYEQYFEALPILQHPDPLVSEKVAYSSAVLTKLGLCLQESTSLYNAQVSNTFSRDILAIESQDNGRKPGAEIIVAHWGAGFISPIHGHVAGLHYENLISGKFRAHTYRQVDPSSKTVRLVETQIVKDSGPFVSVYEEQPEGNSFERPLMIHNFEALTETHSLHFLPEHSLDGMGNGFTPEYFEDVHSLQISDTTEITALQGLYVPIGSVILVWSSNVPDYGDHYIVITGKPVVKEHGLRPEEHTIQAPHAARILDPFAGRDLILLMLNKDMTKRFYEFHGIEFSGGKVIFPKH